MFLEGYKDKVMNTKFNLLYKVPRPFFPFFPSQHTLSYYDFFLSYIKERDIQYVKDPREENMSYIERYNFYKKLLANLPEKMSPATKVLVYVKDLSTDLTYDYDFESTATFYKEILSGEFVPQSQPLSGSLPEVTEPVPPPISESILEPESKQESPPAFDPSKDLW